MTGKTHLHQNTKPSSNQMFLYDHSNARVLVIIISKFNNRLTLMTDQVGGQFVTTYSLNKAYKKFGDKSTKSAKKETAQLHDRECFKPIHKKDLIEIEKKQALESLIFLTEKKSGELKARHCANGSTQQQYMDQEEVSSPTVSTESTILTAVIEAYKNHNVSTGDILSAFIQTSHPIEDKDRHKTIIRMRGKVVEILC